MSRTCFLQASLIVLSTLALFAARPTAAQISLRVESFQVPGTNPFAGSLAGAISANGTIWATSVGSNFAAHGAISNPNGTYTAVNYPQSIGTNTQGINFIPGTVSYGGINNAGDVTGTFFYFDSLGNGQSTYFIYHNGTFISPQVAGATSTNYNGVNEAGQVATVYQDAAGHNHSAIYNLATGSFTLLSDASGYADTDIITVLPSGAVLENVGNRVIDPVTQDEYLRGSITLNNVTTFFDVPGALDTRLDAVTSTGLYSGNYLDAGHIRHGFVYDTTDNQLFTIDGDPSATFTTLRFSNSDTQFVGWWNDPNGGYHSLLVTAVPEPGSIALLVGMSVAGAGFLRRKTRKIRAC